MSKATFPLRITPLAILLAMTCCCASTRAAEPDDKEYPIRLSMPYKLKEKHDLTMSATRSVTEVLTVAGEKPAKPNVETLAVQVEATAEPLVIDSKGRPTKIAFTIKKFTRTDGKDPVEILPAGTVVFVDATGKNPAAKKGETSYTLEKGQLTPEQLDALQLAIDADQPEGPTDDECYGTAAKKKVGDSWPINVAKAAKDPTLEGWALTPEHSKAKVTLDGVDSIDGKEWVKTRMEISSDKFDGPPEPGQIIATGSLQLKNVVSCPVEATSAQLNGVFDLTIAFVAKQAAAGAEVPALSVETTTKIHEEWRIAPQAAAH